MHRTVPFYFLALEFSLLVEIISESGTCCDVCLTPYRIENLLLKSELRQIISIIRVFLVFRSTCLCLPANVVIRFK